LVYIHRSDQVFKILVLTIPIRRLFEDPVLSFKTVTNIVIRDVPVGSFFLRMEALTDEAPVKYSVYGLP